MSCSHSWCDSHVSIIKRERKKNGQHRRGEVEEEEMQQVRESFQHINGVKSISSQKNQHIIARKKKKEYDSKNLMYDATATLPFIWIISKKWMKTSIKTRPDSKNCQKLLLRSLLIFYFYYYYFFFFFFFFPIRWKMKTLHEW